LLGHDILSSVAIADSSIHHRFSDVADRRPTAYSSGILAYAFLAALRTLPFQQCFCLRLDAVPRRLELHERRQS